VPGGSDAPALAGEWGEVLREHAAGYAKVALTNIAREFPAIAFQLMTGPDDVPKRPRDISPVFFGSLDWHSCVEMHWLLVRLLREVGDAVPAGEIRAALDAQFTGDGLAAEAAFVASRGGAREYPYGWGWALLLVHETAGWDDPDARRWAAAMAEFADTLAGRFLARLPKETYPIRHGLHHNSAFGLSRALPYARGLARAGKPELADAITAKALGWYRDDAGYPGDYEPSGNDFLSPALAEAELMAQLLPAAEFAAWLQNFLPGIESGRPAALFTPAVVSDSTDGLIAHLHGLNASRAWCWRRIAESLPGDDPRIGQALLAARVHADAALPQVIGSDYMVEHWLAAYAVLMLG
jgi:hypothetical protein